MIYLQKSRAPKRNFFLISILVFVLIVAAIFALQMFASEGTEKLALTVGGPFSSAYSNLKNKFHLAGAFIHSRTFLIEENRRLQALIAENEDKVSRFDSLLQEHEELLTDYGRSSSTTSATAVVVGNVIARPPQSPYDVIVTDIGVRDGISVGQKAYSSGGIPVGRVSEATNSFSKIVMFSSADEKNQVTIERTSETVTVNGLGGGNLETEVAQEMDIVVGDVVVLPEFNAAVVATVVEVESSPTSAFKRVLFQSPINIFKLRWVEVLEADQETGRQTAEQTDQ